MVWLKLILVALLLVSCGQDNSYDKEYYIETAELEVYVERFEALSEGLVRVSDSGLVVVFGDTEGSIVGTCTTVKNKSPRVVIDRDFWSRARDTAKENLMFHELGHCLLYRGHRSDKRGGVPVSLMNLSLITSFYEEDRDSYIEELFSNLGSYLSLTEEDKNWSCGGNHDN